jgi:hypothetical protein
VAAAARSANVRRVPDATLQVEKDDDAMMNAPRCLDGDSRQ